MDITVGIDAIGFDTSNYVLLLSTLAAARNSDAAKFFHGLGIEQMSIAPPDCDIVTMAANAGARALQHADANNISLLLLATETGIDQSKAAGIYVHKLLNLNPRCRVLELKQACYSATAGLQLAAAHIRQNPHTTALVIATDIARYQLQSPGEPTQGCGAIAMLVSAKPRLLCLEPGAGLHTEDVMDFWRPNYCTEPLVDGKYSIQIYLNSLVKTWDHLCEQTRCNYTDFAHFCYHAPFPKMVEKAHESLATHMQISLQREQLRADLAPSIYYNKLVGNCYTAALYISLLSLLEQSATDLTNKTIGLFSYGSGACAEFFRVTVQPNYQQHLDTHYNKQIIHSREPISFERYLEFFAAKQPQDGSELNLDIYSTRKFRLAKYAAHKRFYVEGAA